MIEEQSYWRADLTKYAQRLKRRYGKLRWSKQTLYEIEKEVFLSAFIIRKLIESGKVDRAVLGLNFQIKKYPIRPGAVRSTDPKTLGSIYDIYHGRDEILSIKKLCDQFVHSYIFSPLIISRTHGVVFGLYFSSDCESEKGLYYIPLIKVIEIITSSACNRPIKIKLSKKVDGTFNVKCESGRELERDR
jgi:hypothetical protein